MGLRVRGYEAGTNADSSLPGQKRCNGKEESEGGTERPVRRRITLSRKAPRELPPRQGQVLR